MTIKPFISSILTVLCLWYVSIQHHTLDSGKQNSAWPPPQAAPCFWAPSSGWDYEGWIRAVRWGTLSPPGSCVTSSSHLDQNIPAIQGDFPLMELHKIGLPEWSWCADLNQIVSLDRNPPKLFAWPHYTLKVALFPVIKTVCFNFKQANVFTGAIDHYISLSLHGFFFYIRQRKQSNKHYAYSETKLQCHVKIAILCTLVDVKRYLCIL